MGWIYYQRIGETINYVNLTYPITLNHLYSITSSHSRSSFDPTSTSNVSYAALGICATVLTRVNAEGIQISRQIQNSINRFIFIGY